MTNNLDVGGPGGPLVVDFPSAGSGSVRPPDREAVSALASAVLGAIPDRLRRALSVAAVRRWCIPAAAHGWSPAQVASAAREHGWDSARGAGAVIEWLRVDLAAGAPPGPAGAGSGDPRLVEAAAVRAAMIRRRAEHQAAVAAAGTDEVRSAREAAIAQIRDLTAQRRMAREQQEHSRRERNRVLSAPIASNVGPLSVGEATVSDSPATSSMEAS